MSIIKAANKIMSKFAEKMSIEQAESILGVSKDDPKGYIYNKYETLMELLEEEGDTDSIIEAEAALRRILGIEDANLDNYGNKLEESYQDDEQEEVDFENLDSKLKDFQDNMFTMSPDEIKYLYENLDNEVKDFMTKY